MTLETTYLQPNQIFDGKVLRRGYVAVKSGSITGILDTLPAGLSAQTLQGTLSPGYLDLQVNGGGDALLNNTPTLQAMQTMADAHRRFGTVAIMPTIITDTPEVLDRAAEAALQAHGVRGILGLHIEGPHLSLARRGTHAAQFIRPLDARTLSVVQQLCKAGLRVMITVAPEAVAQGQIAQLVAMGAVVSLGHSDATAQQTRACLAEGAICFTHLFNAMSPMQSRAAGMTGAAITSAAYAGVICDGIHVADEMLALALRARPQADTTFLVSDAMATVGGSEHFTLYDQKIQLVDGRLINAEGSLAGAHTTMAEGVARLITQIGLDPAAALRMATTIPAKVIGRSTGLVGQSLNDCLLLGPDWAVTQTGLG
jgi:N-acetylglucosamine-6-phosphate deacetylase